MKGLCDCPICRRGIRDNILAVFRRRPYWQGFYQIRHAAGLGWVPTEFYREVVGEMVRRGLLIAVAPTSAKCDFYTYLPWSLAVPARAGKRGGS